MKLIFEKSKSGRRGYLNPPSDVDVVGEIPEHCRRGVDCPLPELTELEVVRHFTRLSQKNFSVDTQFYPLGSCTMKYNPKFTEKIANMESFTQMHPLTPQLCHGEKWAQGSLGVLYEAEELLCEITGMQAFTMQPLAGAHGELTGVMMIAAYHKARSNKKKYIIIPDAAHGTNPATAAIAGYETKSVPTDEHGVMDIKALEAVVDDDVAGLMLTCPNTHGIFNSHIEKISELIHSVDGIMYYDGANLNAVMGKCRPGDIGFDVVHLNLHKTFATPHGGGGPGSGPVGVSEKLIAYLPISRVMKRDDGVYYLNYDLKDSIGYIASFYGNFSVILKAFAYILILGKEGLIKTSEHAVVNANYMLARLKDHFDLPYDRTCMHEVVFSASNQAARGVHAIDIAKYLIEQGVHPPTIYFPLSVKEAMMIEPTETETKDAMDDFIAKMIEADKLSQSQPEVFHSLPQNTPISRPDEVKAAREINTNYFNQ